MKAVIGVIPLWDDEKESLWMLPGYLEGLEAAGALPLVFPLTTDKADLAQLVDLCDGILFTGGHDVSPSLYGERPLEGLVGCCGKRDEMEMAVLHLAMEKRLAILGICRGIQFINVALGGSLYQDLPSQHPSAIEHHQMPPYDVPVHSVEIVKGSPLHALLGKDSLQVNSYHHQAVKELSEELDVMATSPDGLIEAVCKPDYPFLWATQWHPEFNWRVEESSRKIFTSFVKAAESR